MAITAPRNEDGEHAQGSWDDIHAPRFCRRVSCSVGLVLCCGCHGARSHVRTRRSGEPSTRDQPLKMWSEIVALALCHKRAAQCPASISSRKASEFTAGRFACRSSLCTEILRPSAPRLEPSLVGGALFSRITGGLGTACDACFGDADLMGISATVDGFVSSLGATCLSGASATTLSASGTDRLSQNPAPATATATNIHVTPRLVDE